MLHSQHMSPERDNHNFLPSSNNFDFVSFKPLVDLPRFDSASLMINTSHQGERLWQRYTMKSLSVRQCGLH